MDFTYDEAQTAVADLARKVLRGRVTQESLRAVEADPDRFDRALWKELASLDLLGTAQHGLLATCALLVEAGAAVAPVPLWPTLVLGAMPIARFATDDQRAKWLHGMNEGEAVLTAALVETGFDDAARPETRAKKTAGGWELFGVKEHVPAATIASRVLVPARLDDDRVAVFVIDPRGKGVRVERQIATTGEPWGRITLHAAPVVASDALGGIDRGLEVVQWLVPRATVGLCALALGVTDRALRMTAEYTTQRTQFDRPIATFQAVAQRAADAYVDVEAIRVATWQAAWRLANDLPSAREVAIAKYWACEAGHRVTYAAQHLHGGMGFDLEYPLHRHYLMAKQIELTLGSASEQLAHLGAELASTSVTGR